ncbi:MAG: CheR family methyltransferase [Pirellulaceae bacterium]
MKWFRTREGLYSHFEANRGLPANLLSKYFDRIGMKWQAKLELRRMIDAKRLNLFAPWPALPSFDLVFIRNVLIYFDEQGKTNILQRLRRTIAPDAFVVLGGGETLLNMNVPFVRDEHPSIVCFRPVKVGVGMPIVSTSPLTPVTKTPLS